MWLSFPHINTFVNVSHLFMHSWSNNFWISEVAMVFYGVVPIVRFRVTDLVLRFPVQNTKSAYTFYQPFHMFPHLFHISISTHHKWLTIFTFGSKPVPFLFFPSKFNAVTFGLSAYCWKCWYAQDLFIFNIRKKQNQNFNYIQKTYCAHLKTPKCHLK